LIASRSWPRRDRLRGHRHVPIGLALNPGEQLRLVISGHHLLGGAMPGVDNVPSDNHGRHVIHTGDRHASYLQLPQKA